MTKENAHLYLPLVQALAEGKTIQLHVNSNPPEWIDDTNGFSFVNPPEKYRIKPEPVMVPLGPEDVPPGSVIRSGSGWCLITCATGDGFQMGQEKGELSTNTWKTAMSLFQIKRPGQDWMACSKPA